MFPLALYVQEMAFFKTPLGKTFPELFYFTVVEASKSAMSDQFPQPRHAVWRVTESNFTIRIMENNYLF